MLNPFVSPSTVERAVAQCNVANSIVKVVRDDALSPVPYLARVDYRPLPMSFQSPAAAVAYVQDNIERIRELDDLRLLPSPGL
jgi:hypothetical protein